MINFEKCSWRNFFSTGDKFTELDLTSDRITLITGRNGHGKSTFIDAISFGLFGKPHRNINKPMVINSINGKNCEVHLTFNVDGHTKYEVKRGLKPHYFEIYKNGVLLNQESHNRDYQAILENQILKMNHKSFHQVVCLGSGNYIPFMQLKAYQRRAVIDDLLDITVISDMNEVLKEKVGINRNRLNLVNSKLELIATQIKLKKKHLNELTEISLKESVKNEKKISELNSEIELLEKRTAKLKSQYDKILPQLQIKLEKKRSEHSENRKRINELEHNLNITTKHKEFFEHNDICPTCSQTISDDLKQAKIIEYTSSSSSVDKCLNEIREDNEKVQNVLTELEMGILKMGDLSADIKSNTKMIDLLCERRKSLDSESNVTSIDTKLLKDQISADKAELSSYVDEKQKLVEYREYLGAVSEILKDSGIKTKIVKQYLPVMNKLINQYLDILDFFVKFELDEEFNETIKSRHRDIFKYESFSEGEKARIDLALLFAWRQIARMKNSSSTNLLILDEVFSGNLDAAGSENLMRILDTLPEQVRIYVITHDPIMMDNKFDRKIKVEKINNFSTIKIEKS